MSQPTSASGATAGGGGGVVDAILQSLFQPGLNTVTQRIMNFAFYSLFFCLLALLWLTGGNPHVIALLVLSIGLYAGVNWFLLELSRLPPSAKDVQQMPPQEEDKKAQ